MIPSSTKKKWKLAVGARSQRILRERKNLLLLSFAVTSFGSVVSLAALGVERFAVYVSVLTLAYFAISLAFRVKRRRNFDFLAAALAVVFIVAIFTSIVIPG